MWWNTRLYTGSTSISFICQWLSICLPMINDELKYIVIWLRANKLTLNISITQYMLFSNTKVIQPNVTIEISGQPITCVTKTKFLGVIIDNTLTWKEHISHICGKVVKSIGIISKVRKCLNKNTLLYLYYSFIYPCLTYCNQVWGLSCQSYMNALVKLQKRAIRIIPGVHPITHTDPLFTKLKLLSNVMKLTNTWLVDSCLGYIMRI